MNTYENRPTPESLNLREVSLGKPDDFLKIKETLTRIGVPSNKTKTLYQTCHILHKRGKYYIVHFKEIYQLDGNFSGEFSDEDILRRDFIISLLLSWDLCKPVNFDLSAVDPDKIKSVAVSTKVLKFGEKKDWTLAAKHSLGQNQNV